MLGSNPQEINAELSVLEDRVWYLTAAEAAAELDVPYKSFMRHLKVFIEQGEYPVGAFRVTPPFGKKRRVEIHPVKGMELLRKLYFPRRDDPRF